MTSERIPTVTLNTVVCRSDDIISTKIEDEAVMMSIQKGKYFGMDDIASRIWELIKTPCKVKDLINTLIAEYAVDHITCEQDIVPFLEQLLTEGIVGVDTPS